MLESYRTTLVLLHIALILAYIWLKSFYNYWQKNGIPFITPSLLAGNFKEMIILKRCPAEQFQAMYMNSATASEPLVGIHIFHKAAVLLRHPELIKRILVKDFTKFSDRYSTSDLYADSLGSKNLFFIKNPAWREIRSKISPVFTSGKIKQMFPLVEEIGRQLDSYLKSLPVDPTTQSTCQELKEICALYTTDVIATVAYGVQANSLKNPNGEFRSHGRFIFDFTTKRAIEFVTVFFLPRLVPFFRFKVFPKHSAKFLRSTINYVMRVREESGMARNDLIDILLEFERSAKADRRKSQIALEGDILVAQAALFFTAGFETSSSAMSFALFELAKRPDLQNRLRCEIRDALEENGGEINYRMIIGLQYLHMIIQEVLRLYPPLGFLDRECTLPEGEEYSFDPFSSLTIGRGMPIYIPVFGLQRDPKYFVNPNEFDPERFSPENKPKIVPFTYMPFGTGPHSCIGERFAMLQAKIGLVNFFRNHYVTTCEKSMPEMKLDPKALITQPKGGIYCNIIIDMFLISELLVFLTTVIFAIYIWSKYNYTYWRRKNVPYIEPNIFCGNIKEMINFSKNVADHFVDLYNHPKAENEPVLGIYIFQKPALLIRDLNLIKSILVKDFNKFANRFSCSDPHGDPLGANNLFFMKNPMWKEMRTKLTPVFTSGKIKQMFPLVEEIGRELDSYLCDLPMDSNSCVQEIKEINSLYTTDVIASVAYGVHANSLKNPNADFRRNGREVFTFNLMRAFEFTALFFMPYLVPVFRCKVFTKKTTKFIRDTMNLIMAERMRSGAVRNDLIDILVAFKKERELEPDTKKTFVMTDDMLIAQAGIFFTAGFETTSATMSFGLYELSKKPELQKRLREEIRNVLKENDGKVTYDVINKMEYLSMVIQEVLRMYPPLPFLDRECILGRDEKEYSLEPYSEFTVPNGMPVMIPIYAIQRDPKYFPNPNEFDPERFAPENKGNIVPFSYMPFGTGPHNCIGERFAIVQSKIGFINFLRNHYVVPCDKSQDTMVLNPKALIIQSDGGIYCSVVRDPLI